MPAKPKQIVDSLLHVASNVARSVNGEWVVQCDHLVKGRSYREIIEIELGHELGEEFKSRSACLKDGWTEKLYVCSACAEKTQQIFRGLGFEKLADDNPAVVSVRKMDAAVEEVCAAKRRQN